MKLYVILGSIDNIIYMNNENYFTILRIKENDGNLITAKGIFPECVQIGEKKSKGLSVTLYGEWGKDRKYGRQFNFTRATIDNTGLMFFLTHIVKGIGKNLATKLINHYGEAELEDIIEHSPEVLLDFKGIKEKKLKKIVSSWHKHKQIKELSKFFAQREVDITANMIIRIYKHFEDEDFENRDIVDLISENPYILTKIRGIGFKTCDKIALQLGIDEDSPARIEALLDYILLSEASDYGHTYLTLEQIYEKAIEYLYKDEVDTATKKINNLQNLIENVLESNGSKYYYDTDEKGDKIASMIFYKRKEEEIFKFAYRRTNMRSKFKVSEEDAKKFIATEERKIGFKLSQEQYKAIFDIATEGYMIYALCGYAGTGKSTISKIILDFFAQFIPRNKITCCAFTGMASKRIKDTTKYNSATIHSLLQYQGNGFAYNSDNPLPYNVVLLDEASMVNVDIFNALVGAIGKDTVFIMVGDDAQLPPIGAGNIFSDILSWEKVPKTKLTKIYRQSQDSVLTHFANHIRQGKVPPKYKGNYKDWKFEAMDIDGYFEMKKSASERELKEIRENHYQTMLESLLDDIDKIISEKKLTLLSRVWDIQVITPMKNTVLGTKNLNTVLQEILNPTSKIQVSIRGHLLKIYDKVIHLKNKNMQYVTLDDFIHNGIDEEYSNNIRIYNGALGIVIGINEEDEEFYVLYPDSENIVAAYSFDDYKNIIDLGYALTIHKTQGNQFKYVFIPLINSFYVMLNSKLIYTAVTRAIEKVFIKAQKYAFTFSCKNVLKTERQTFLKNWFTEKWRFHWKEEEDMTLVLSKTI